MRLPKASQYRILLIFIFAFHLSGACLFGKGMAQPDLSTEESDSVPSTTETESEPLGGNISAHLSFSKIHHLGIDYRPEYVLQTNDFVKGKYDLGKRITQSHAIHLKYSFSFAENSLPNTLYHNVYQGVGLSFQTFGEMGKLGNPASLYLFQGAKLLNINPKLSFNYEWNFGLSFGWEPYNYYSNPYNTAIGSRVNAYMNLNFYLNYCLSPQFDLITGVSVTHFSNGNTKFPNSGLNTLGMRVGLVYNLERKKEEASKNVFAQPMIQKFPKHISYDWIMFGSWKQKGVDINGESYSSPDSYSVMGFNFSSLYNLSYIFRTGLSLDGVYDQSANIYFKEFSKDYAPIFEKPGLDRQMALGLSARSELVMPYFSINLGVGANFLGKGDMKGTYQTLALKIEVFKSSFLHIGYNLKDFHTPNYLMLGIGYRFHDKYPTIYRK